MNKRRFKCGASTGAHPDHSSAGSKPTARWEMWDSAGLCWLPLLRWLFLATVLRCQDETGAVVLSSTSASVHSIYCRQYVQWLKKVKTHSQEFGRSEFSHEMQKLDAINDTCKLETKKSGGVRVSSPWRDCDKLSLPSVQIGVFIRCWQETSSRFI